MLHPRRYVPKPDGFHDCGYDSDSDAGSAHPSELFSHNGTEETAATSVSERSRASSPTPSVFSMTSSIHAMAYREEFGRMVNNYSEVYRLPADDDELDRLDAQHEMFKDIMGKYPPPIYDILRDTPGEQKAVLDLGAGSGRWCADIAEDFPHCTVVGVDLVPIQPLTEIPPNMRSEVDDVNFGLEHFYGEFDVVHCRLASSGIRDYAEMIDQCSHVLRPGGLLEVMEFDFRVYGPDHKPIKPVTTLMQPPWLPRWMEFLHMAVRQRGGSPSAANSLHTWVRSHPAYEDVVYHEIWIPTSPWARGEDSASQRKRRHGKQMGDDIMEFLKSGRPLLLGSNMPIALLNDLEAKARQEIEQAQMPHYIRVESVYARRKRAPNMP